MKAASGSNRCASVDALRGIAVAAMLLVNNPGDWSHVYAPLRHAKWHGCTPTDLIFPFFLFVVGVSIALGPGARAPVDAPQRAAMSRAIGLRALRIVVLGLLLHLLAWALLRQEHFRPWGVLQRIGICFAVAGWLALYARPAMQWWLLWALLLGYWALLAWGGSYAPYDNLADRVDTALLGPWLYRYDAATGRGHDPEGLLSTLPALATTLLGLRAGDWLRQGRLRRLGIAGVALALAGMLWAQALPFNKSLWTSSFVLWTGGLAALSLLALHVLVDRRGWPALGRRFGVNAIVAYAGSAAMVYLLMALGIWEPLYRIGFAGGMTRHSGPYLPSLVFALAFVGVWWLIVRALDRRGWRLRI